MDETTPQNEPGAVTRELPPLEIRAAIKPGSVDVEKRTAEIIWTTGARVLRGYYDRFYEELSLDPRHVRMGRLESGRAPLCDSHNAWSVVDQPGVVESARLEPTQGVATVRFARAEDDPKAEQLFRKVVDRIIANASVGYRVYKYEKVEGGDETIPVYRATDWEPYEISLCPMGADAGAGVRSAEQRGDQPLTNACVFVTRGEETKMKTTPPAAPAATPPPPQEETRAATPAQDESAVKAANEAGAKAERERATGIRAAVRAAKLGDDVAEKLINDGTSLDKARAHVLDQLAAADEKVRTEQHVRVEVTDDAKDRWSRGATAWLLQRSGYADLVERAAKKAPNNPAFRGIELDPGEVRGFSLVDLARESLAMRNVSTRGMDRMKLVGTAFTHRSGGYSSTSDFPVLLENVLHKVLQAAYAMAEDTWKKFCAVGSVSDFRAHNRYRVGSFGELDVVNEGGEFKRKAIPDGEKGTISATTKGNIIALTRQAIINDDLGQFMSLANRLGRAAALSIEVDVFDLIGENSGLGPTQSDSQPLLHSNRANVNASGSALSVAGLDADRVVMSQQKDPASKEYLALRPAILLVAVGLGAAARVINSSIYDHDGTKLQKPNPVVGLFREVVDTPRLSGTRRYLLADPNIAPVFEVAFLDGQQSPFMESKEGWDIDGTEWKVRIDYGVAAVDFRGIVTNAGA